MNPNYILLPVEDPAASAAFWTRFLETRPVEVSPTFVLMPLPHGWMLGLWGRAGIEPPVTSPAGGVEIGVRLDTPEGVDALHARLDTEGARLLSAPAEQDFGRTFVAADPDGHRIRVFCLSE